MPTIAIGSCRASVSARFCCWSLLGLVGRDAGVTRSTFSCDAAIIVLRSPIAIRGQWCRRPGRPGRRHPWRRSRPRSSSVPAAGVCGTASARASTASSSPAARSRCRRDGGQQTAHLVVGDRRAGRLRGASSVSAQAASAAGVGWSKTSVAGSRSPVAAEPVAQLDGGQRVEAELLERPVRRSTASGWRGRARSPRLGAHQVQQARAARRPRAARPAGGPVRQSAAARAGRQRRRPARGPGRAAAAAPSRRGRAARAPRRRDSATSTAGSARQGRVEQRQALARRRAGDARRGHRAGRPRLEVAGHAAGPRPEAPGQRHGRAGRPPGGARRARPGRRWPRRSWPGPALPKTPADRGEQHERRRGRRPGSARAGARRRPPSGAGRPRAASGSARRSRASSSTPAACTTAVSGCSAGTAASSAGQRVAVGGVAGGDRHLGRRAAVSSVASSAAPGARRGPRRLSSSRCRTPCSATRCRATRAPSAPVPPVIRTVPSGSGAAGHGEHHLADVPGLAQETERLGGLPDVPGRSPAAAGARRCRTAASTRRSIARIRSVAGLDQVEGAVGDAGVGGGDLGRIADVGLAHLHEPAAVRAAGAARRRRTRRPGSSRTTSTPRPPVAARTVGSKSRLREEAIVPRDAQRAQRLPLAGAGGAVHLGAEVPGQLDRGHADAAGRRVDQHRLARRRAARSTSP